MTKDPELNLQGPLRELSRSRRRETSSLRLLVIPSQGNAPRVVYTREEPLASEEGFKANSEDSLPRSE